VKFSELCIVFSLSFFSLSSSLLSASAWCH
jgi:hypothetical protein